MVCIIYYKVICGSLIKLSASPQKNIKHMWYNNNRKKTILYENIPYIINIKLNVKHHVLYVPGVSFI